MYFLTSPDMAASQQEWEDWLIELQKLPEKDESVQFSLKIATRHLAFLKRQE